MQRPNDFVDISMIATTTAIIAVGSNIGDSLHHCRSGIARLEIQQLGRITGQSAFYRSEPVDYLDQDWFVNAAVRMETHLSPEQLLAALQRIEKKMGRKAAKIRFGPRVLDLDIIFFGERVIRQKALQIPHPRMHKRRFVLLPVCDIDPEINHPVLQRSVRDLLDQLEPEGQGLIRIDD